MKKKIMAIFATALLLALCSIPCFAYPSQNLTFGGFYQNEDVTPYSVQEFRGTFQANTVTKVFTVNDLSQEISGFIVVLEVPFTSGYTGDCRLYFEERYSDGYVLSDIITVNSYMGTSSVFYFVVPRRGVDSLHLYVTLSDYYSFADDDPSILTTLYPISLNTSEIEETAYNSGLQVGYNDGLVDGQGVAEDLDGFLVDVFAALATFFQPFTTFEIWGINVMGVLSLVVIATIAVIIFKMKS